MPLSRNPRNDRRRRAVLDSIASDAEFAVETVRARKRSKAKSQDEESDEIRGPRDPGYSQAVRSACQHRLVQLIPVRRGTVAIVLSVFWASFCVLLVGHYAIHTTGLAYGTLSLATLPIGQLFHLRSPHGIAHWLTCQMWLLTAISCWMIFNLRRHKLDDYRARYRIWIFIAVAAFFSSFDASTSALQLFGMSIDGWTRREIGYGGWPLVLAMFASLIGVLGIRLSTELKSVPSSVASWIVGLVAWAASALLGTGLLKVPMTAPYLDLLVGSLWLGGILAVFQSSAMYLRTTYIQAQKRFLQRNGCELNPIQWKMPKIKVGLKRRSATPSSTDEYAETDTHQASNRWKLPWISRKASDNDGSYDELDSIEPSEGKRPNKSNLQTTGKDGATPGKLFGVIPNRHLRNENPEFDPITEDDGGEVDLGLTKKRGWFGIGGNRELEPESSNASKRSHNPSSANDQESPNSQGGVGRSPWWKRKRGDDAETSNEASPRKRLMSRWKRDESKESGADKTPIESKNGGKESRSSGSTKDAPKDATKGSWKSKLPKFPAWKSKSGGSPAQEDGLGGSDKKETSSTKKSLFGLRGNRGNDAQAASAESSKPNSRKEKMVTKEESPKEKKGWLGMLDGLKLKPPAEDPKDTSKNTNSASSKPPNSNIPSQAPAAKQTAAPTPVKPGASKPSTDSYDEDDDQDQRSMSKADRKKLRRQQDDRRAA